MYWDRMKGFGCMKVYSGEALEGKSTTQSDEHAKSVQCKKRKKNQKKWKKFHHRMCVYTPAFVCLRVILTERVQKDV